jgi:benzil reductase ((S)-benzoin forming)
MKKKVLIITGGSKGIGRALVKTYLKEGFEVHSISRTFDENVSDSLLFQYPFDLENIPQIANLLTQIIERFNGDEIEKITLINNAATLGRIGTLEKSSTEDLQAAIDINLTAPMVLSASFINQLQDWTCEKSIVNLSSGAAQKPYHGWVPYCTTKAAIEMLTRGIAREQGFQIHPIKSIAIIPGVVETGMQEEVRKASKENFNAIERFIELKEKGMLSNPDDIARKIFEVDHNAAIANGEIVNVREN